MKKKIKRNCKYLFVVLILLIGVSGCKTKKKIASTTPIEEIKKETDISPAKTTKLQPTYLNYDWLSYRMNVSIMDYNTKKETVNVSAFFVNRRDSVIYITVNKIIELARVVITPDSVKFINNLENTYYSGDYSFISKMIGFNVRFDMLQAILVGEDIRGLDVKVISQEIKMNNNNKIIENNIKENKTQASLSAKYSDFALVDVSQLFFQLMELSIPSEKILLNIKTSATKINVPGPTSIKIPEKYKPINLK